MLPRRWRIGRRIKVRDAHREEGERERERGWGGDIEEERVRAREKIEEGREQKRMKETE